MAIQNYRKQATRFFIGRINNEGLRETLKLENNNALPKVSRDKFEAGKGFENSRTANQGVNFFNSVEEEKRDSRQYWYFLVNNTNIEIVPLDENTDPKIIEYFNGNEEEEVTEE